MVVNSGELHLQRVAEATAEIKRDFASGGVPLPSDLVLRRAADIVASYPDAWSRYDAPPDDWDGRSAVAILWTWRKLKTAGTVPRAAAA